jgi:hypothetical protein
LRRAAEDALMCCAARPAELLLRLRLNQREHACIQTFYVYTNRVQIFESM